MTKNAVQVLLETGQKRVIASAVDWPGWCRGAKTRAEALQALLDYAPRYQKIIKALPFDPPTTPQAFSVVEEQPGTSTTDFGVPAEVATVEQQPMDERELERVKAIFHAAWRALTQAFRATEGKSLRKGPRGGGRDPEKILAHVLDAQSGYLSKIGWKLPAPPEDQAPLDRIKATAAAVEQALAASAHGELPAHGPRGGKHWPARYFARRALWHILDHVWEIEDRLED